MRPMSPTGDRVSQAQSFWLGQKGTILDWFGTLVPLPAYPSPCPPPSGWQEVGPISANQQPGRTRALSSVAMATIPFFWIPGTVYMVQ